MVVEMKSDFRGLHPQLRKISRTILQTPPPAGIQAPRRTLAAAPTTSSKLEDDRNALLQQIRNEATSLTLSLYRRCVRSAYIIRQANEHDEKEFSEREKKRLQSMENTDVRLTMLSMLPPVDRADELRSRFEYYLSYARENFVQESDCLIDDNIMDTRQIDRYLYLLRRGEEHRKWLLEDMKFEDPYKLTFNHGRVKSFETKVQSFLSKPADGIDAGGTGETSDATDETFWDSDEDEEEETSQMPEWYRNPRSND